LEQDVAEIDSRLRLAQGDITGAAQTLERAGIQSKDQVDYQRLKYYIVLARVSIADGRLREALELLGRLSAIAQAAGATSEYVEILVMQAVAYYQQGMNESAFSILSRALSTAQPEGYVRIFIDEGRVMLEMLRRLVVQGDSLAYVSRLLNALNEEGCVSPQSQEAALAEALSERELQVLRLLAVGMSSTQVAEELTLAVSTARTHIKHIYRKLDVHSRLDAIGRATELGLILSCATRNNSIFQSVLVSPHLSPIKGYGTFPYDPFRLIAKYPTLYTLSE
jgi:LuxR family maltose regulon positive regulatory protein